MYDRCCIVGIVLFASILGADSLFCFKCLNIDCPSEDMECQSMRSFMQKELRHLYHFGSYLDPCPAVEDVYTWRIMQATDTACPEEKAGAATCTLGRMQIKTTKTNPEGKSTDIINHATIMGCANIKLLLRIGSAFEQKGQCDLAVVNQTDVGIVRSLQIEHCRDIKMQCHEKDYCVNYTQSTVKLWGDQKLDAKKFENTLKLGIFAIVVVIILALLIAGLLREPASRPSNFPKTIGDESESVKVLQVTHEKDKLTAIEVDQHSGNGTMSRRPNVPPPPPPRLHKPLVRESTPV